MTNREYYQKDCKMLECETVCKYNSMPLSPRNEDIYFFSLQLSALTNASLLHNYLHLYAFHFFMLILWSQITYSSFHHPICHIHQRGVYFSIFYKRIKCLACIPRSLHFLHILNSSQHLQCHTLKLGFIWSYLKPQ